VNIAGTGIMSATLRYGDPVEIATAAAELESLGYTALWVPDFGGDVFADLDRLLGATATITVATGVLNVWMQSPDAANVWWAGLSADHRDRVLLGLGVSHGSLVGEGWGRPLETMSEFLDALEVPEDHRSIAALGPKMLDLARERTAGSHPYLITPEHTATERQRLGPDKLLTVALAVVLEPDPARARERAREELQLYATLPNYTNNWKRVGFTDSDVASISDALIDAVVAWGDVEAIGQRVAEHRAAGADHVCLSVMPDRDPGVAWRALAGV
jgi:probable F420-dependent oxidoreductase